MTQEDLNEWKKDIGEANNHYPHIANGPFIRAWFKMSCEIDSVGQQMARLSKSVDDVQKELLSLNSQIGKASASSDKHSDAMKWLTRGLVFLGFVQVIIAYLPYHDQNRQMDIRKGCFSKTLQTKDVDLSYKDCLRGQGLTD